MARCHNPKHANYPNWGARGIKVCDRWRYGENGMSGFECFKADKAPRPGGKREFSIERIENNGDYTPSNTCWVPMGHQPRNTRRNVWVGAGGEKMLLADAMRKYGCTVNSGTMHSRIANGWDLMEALTTPPFGRHKR